MAQPHATGRDPAVLDAKKEGVPTEFVVRLFLTSHVGFLTSRESRFVFEGFLECFLASWKPASDFRWLKITDWPAFSCFSKLARKRTNFLVGVLAPTPPLERGSWLK